eukprot:640022-Rhodomonas_salina.1
MQLIRYRDSVWQLGEVHWARAREPPRIMMRVSDSYRSTPRPGRIPSSDWQPEVTEELTRSVQPDSCVCARVMHGADVVLYVCAGQVVAEVGELESAIMISVFDSNQ